MDFVVLDDVLWDSANLNTEQIASAVFDAPATLLGPVVEYMFLQHQNRNLYPSLSRRKRSLVINAVLSACACNDFTEVPVDSSPNGRNVEINFTPPTHHAFEDVRWIGFCKRFQNAAEKSGFRKMTAQALTGAVGEIVSNVFEHSRNPTTGMVGYRWAKGEFEYVVADAGEGVLNSLRRHPDYDNLNDAGTALKLALSDGVSRFGRDSKRGGGFRQLFLSLASLGTSLRFRSEGYRLEIIGESPTLSTARISESVSFRGFFVSVNCQF